MTPAEQIAMALDPSRILAAAGMTPDPWQKQLLLSTQCQTLLNFCRQSGGAARPQQEAKGVAYCR